MGIREGFLEEVLSEMSAIGSGAVKSFHVKVTTGNGAQIGSPLAVVLGDPDKAAQV